LGTTSGPDESGAPVEGAVRASGDEGKARRNSLLDYAVIAVVAIGLALVIQAYLVKPYRIPSPSMVDTLEIGDRVLVNRVVYHLRDLEHGDVVVFRWPKNRDVVFIKRVVGLPGDRLQAKDGRLYVNGVAQEEPYVHETNGVTDPTNPSGTIVGTTMSQPWGLSDEYTVPEGHYFMMGDNRTNSDDSRVWGPVPEDDLIGEAFFVYWPLDRLGTL
jgi:signal peptidase I